MQNIKRSAVFFIPFFIAGALSNVYAGKESCPENAVHCAYLVGLSNNYNDGRYIKLTNSHINSVFCLNNYSIAFIEQKFANKFIGSNSDAYSICTDDTGTNCQPIGIDNFTISKNDKGYFAEPRYFEIDLSKQKKSFPACSFASKDSVRLK